MDAGISSEEIDAPAGVLWNFLQYTYTIYHVDILIVLGSVDLFVPQYASVYAERYKPHAIICSGGVAHHDDILNTGWDKPEADVFRDVMVAMGVDARRIFCEDKSTNTQQNIPNSLGLIKKKNIRKKHIVFVHKPYMTLRTKLTLVQMGVDRMTKVHSPPVSFQIYQKYFSDRARLIHILVGDFQRIIKYQETGHIAKIDVPDKCVDAFDYLVRVGFTAHLIK